MRGVFGGLFDRAVIHRRPDPIPEDEARFIRWLLGAGPPPGPPDNGPADTGPLILSPDQGDRSTTSIDDPYARIKELTRPRPISPQVLAAIGRSVSAAVRRWRR
jgi:hypothetical protein